MGTLSPQSWRTVSNQRENLGVRRAPGGSEGDELQLPCAPLAAEAELQPARQTATVLVVDDERAVRALVAVGLEALGHRVLVAASGHEACELYRQHLGAIDLVVLDLTMPEMSGEQTLCALRAQDENVRALLMTGYAEDDVRERFPEQELSGLLLKPFSRRELLGAVTTALAARPVAQ